VSAGRGESSPNSNFSEGALYTCGGASFDPRQLEGPGDLEESDSELGEALRRLLATPDGAMTDSGWRVVHEKEDETLVAAPSPEGEHPYVTATFTRTEGEWKPAGWGDCLPTVALEDRSPALWSLRSDPAPDATEVELMVTERGCSGGRELTEANTRADVQYLPDSVVITMSVDPLPDVGENGGYTCVGVSPVPITVQLEEPLSGRPLIDAGSYPLLEKS